MTCHSDIKIHWLTSIFSFFIIICGAPLFAQSNFTSINAVYDHTATEWHFYGFDQNEEEYVSSLYLKWPLRNDWNHWTAELRDDYVSIKRSFNLTPAHWELSSSNLSVSIKQKWRNDPNEWDIHYSGNIIKWKTVYPGRLDEWYFELKDGSYFDMWARYPGDPRDWDLEDNAIDVPDEVKLAAMFITVFLTNPRQ